MDPILDKARASQNVLERLGSKIPLFKGYLDRDLRRDADKLQREYVAARLEECKKALDDWSAAATRTGGLDALNDVETARKRLDKVINRVRYADRGYSGFFDVVKVDEAVLARVYEFDLSLVQDAEQVRQTTEWTEGGVQGMIARIDALDARLAQREEILRGIR
ncbi:MAG: hypothetical protein HY317_00460 [Acidobacteria bacterium]|nr:hypothetical protein [Acidobacteriota bacterium]